MARPAPLVLVFSALAAPLAARQIPDSLLQPAMHGMDSLLQERAARGAFSGVVLVGMLNGRGGRVLFARANGIADRGTGAANAVGTRFVTGSVAKTFVAVGALKLVDAGTLALDTAVSRYLPDSVYSHARGDSITVRELLTHTAGLGDVVTGPAFRASPGAITRFEQLLGLVRADSSVGPVGSFVYGGDDYLLLGAILARASGQTFADYMRHAVFEAAGMANTGYILVPRPGDLARGYTTRNLGGPAYARPGDPNGAPLHANDPILPGVGVPGAVAYTTATDLMHFADALWSHRLVSDGALAALWSPQVLTGQGDRNPANRAYGFGFFVGTDGSQRLVNHGGTGPGVDVAFDIYPDLGCVVVVLANLDPPAAQDVRAFVRRAFAEVR
ncbi:MAG TPA: serine hydrolase domain-containing protein [Gemmatimonadales bacterium]|nr:serine hydrolase domain-containing protein [Gemmatimonadales bacterium]